ncbi:MAG: AAA family ATPase [Burkholderiales bacterium]|nr:AAA family ATPase [Burkholderiales bacterium]
MGFHPSLGSAAMILGAARRRTLSPDAELTVADQRLLVAHLAQALRSRQPGAAVELIETHISFVLLAGGFAYKLKKAVSLDFLDFSTLARRRHFCDEELRLNRRLAPDLYLDVVAVTGTLETPVIDGLMNDGAALDGAAGRSAPVLDYLVRMRAFAAADRWDLAAARGALLPRHIDELATRLCRFHAQAPVAGIDTGFGRPEQVRATMLESLAALRAGLFESQDVARLERLMAWERQGWAAIEPALAARLRAGRVRECHGDLHLANLALFDGEVLAFDCIEFNESFRWIDVMRELAFAVMDLRGHGCPDLANRLVNAYLEQSGDYDGVRVLRHYIVERALVRARVAMLRASQVRDDPAQRAVALRQARSYLDLALEQGREAPVALLLTHGFSGSGKTTLTQSLIESAGAIRIRADVERKRLFGLAANERTRNGLNAALYSAASTAATYAQLRRLAMPVLAGGYTAVLDATFLQHAQREQAMTLADALGVPCLILDFVAAPPTLRRRVAERAAREGDASDADLKVLQWQFETAEPLTADERKSTFSYQPP